mmetsp:Transcript_20906/g.47461  ORF Transcript_20906/g.47461 Transcript_20906/m.47461 type:complete len:280 (-) Transcript_20906:160-999(-)
MDGLCGRQLVRLSDAGNLRRPAGTPQSRRSPARRLPSGRLPRAPSPAPASAQPRPRGKFFLRPGLLSPARTVVADVLRHPARRRPLLVFLRPDLPAVSGLLRRHLHDLSLPLRGAPGREAPKDPDDPGRLPQPGPRPSPTTPRPAGPRGRPPAPLPRAADPPPTREGCHAGGAGLHAGHGVIQRRVFHHVDTLGDGERQLSLFSKRGVRGVLRHRLRRFLDRGDQEGQGAATDDLGNIGHGRTWQRGHARRHAGEGGGTNIGHGGTWTRGNAGRHRYVR